MIIEHAGQRKTMEAWSRSIGGSAGLVGLRIRHGWDPIAAITTPPAHEPHLMAKRAAERKRAMHRYRVPKKRR